MAKSRFTYFRMLLRFRRVLRNDHLVLSVLGIFVGCATGGAIIIFREFIQFTQLVLFNSPSENLLHSVIGLPWWQVLAVPTGMGLVVGLIVYRFLPEQRPQGVADVIEANALQGGYMSSRIGLKAAIVNALSIGGGASVGREGPAVHLGASLGAWLARRLHLTRSLNRTLIGCGVGAAVAASFNAPIAGALFASEVVVGHYALKAFAPIVISSVAATALSREYFGDFPAFAFQADILTSFFEFPAFILLGIVSGVAAIVFMKTVFVAQDMARKIPAPPWIRPMIGGFLVGLIALAFPQVLGVGYGATESALLTELSLVLLIAIGLAKILATGISIGFGFGGGVFSPSLVVGAMVGGSFGILATMVFPEYSSGPAAYTMVGMGAVAAAVLGAPISTTLIIFEMTSNYGLTLGVMLAVVAASEVTHHLYGRSFFNIQLMLRGLDVKEGFETEIMRSCRISEVVSNDGDTIYRDTCLQDLRTQLQQSRWGELFVVKRSGELYGTITLADLSTSAFDHGVDDLIKAEDVTRIHPPILTVNDDLETALSLMRDVGEEHIAVVNDADTMIYRGCVHQRDVLTAYNRALLQSRHEEHGE
jgi:chloride channel protein, CIC family